jgi:hypothetical protein
MTASDWFELYDETVDDWLDLPYCERCGLLRGPALDCPACGDAQDGCAPDAKGLPCRELEGSNVGGSQPSVGHRRVPR